MAATPTCWQDQGLYIWLIFIMLMMIVPIFLPCMAVLTACRAAKAAPPMCFCKRRGAHLLSLLHSHDSGPKPNLASLLGCLSSLQDGKGSHSHCHLCQVLQLVRSQTGSPNCHLKPLH